jgi:hypothetical protein
LSSRWFYFWLLLLDELGEGLLSAEVFDSHGLEILELNLSILVGIEDVHE